MLAPFRKSVLRREDLSRFGVSDGAVYIKSCWPQRCPG